MAEKFGTPDKTPNPILIALISQFLSNHGFTSTLKIFANERTKRQWPNGFKPLQDTYGKKLTQDLPQLDVLLRQYLEQNKKSTDVTSQSRRPGSSSSSSSSSSSEVDSSSDSDSDVIVAKNSSSGASNTSSSASSSSESSDSDSESLDIQRKPEVRLLKRKASSPSQSSSSSESSSDSDSDVSEKDTRPKKKPKLRRDSPASESSSSGSSSTSSSSATSDEEDGDDASGVLELAEAIEAPLPESESSQTSSESEPSSSDTSSSSDEEDAVEAQQAKKSATQLNSKAQRASSDSSATIQGDPAPLPPWPVTEKKHVGARPSKLAELSASAKDGDYLSNKYVSYNYADRAYQDLSITRGKGFTKEKNKKKRGSYRGGTIDTSGGKSFKFDD